MKVVECDTPHVGEVFITPTAEQCLGTSLDLNRALADYVGVAKGKAQQWSDDSELTTSQLFQVLDGEQHCPAALMSADQHAELTQSYRAVAGEAPRD